MNDPVPSQGVSEGTAMSAPQTITLTLLETIPLPQPSISGN